MKTRRSSLLLVKQQQKAAAEELRKRNLGVGLVIEDDAAKSAATKNNKTTVFEDELVVSVEEPIVKNDTTDKNEDSSEEDDSAVEEVPFDEARKAVQSQQSAERAFQIATKRKRKKNKKLPPYADHQHEDTLNEELFALLDANKIQNKNHISESKQSSVAVSTENKRTTFVLESSEMQTIVRKAGNFHPIDVVVLEAGDGAHNDPMGFTIGTKPSKVALLLSTTNNHSNSFIMQGLKTSQKAKYGPSRGRPSRLFTK